MSNIEKLGTKDMRLRTRWTLWRNRVLGSRRFQEWAAGTPIFRSVARHKAAGQFDLIAGFVYTQIVYVYVETGLIDFLGAGARSKAEVGDFLKLGEDASDRILRAGAGCASFSRTVTATPRADSSAALVSPPIPAPMITVGASATLVPQSGISFQFDA